MSYAKIIDSLYTSHAIYLRHSISHCDAPSYNNILNFFVMHLTPLHKGATVDMSKFTPVRHRFNKLPVYDDRLLVEKGSPTK